MVATIDDSTALFRYQALPNICSSAGMLSMAKLRWLWPNCREVILPGVSRGVMIIMFVIMLGVRS